MSEVKALFPIGKTQWSKWNDAQRVAFNEARAAGVPFGDAVAGANATKEEKRKKVSVTDVFHAVGDVAEDIADVASDVVSVVTTVTPVVAVAATVAKAVRGKKKAK